MGLACAIAAFTLWTYSVINPSIIDTIRVTYATPPSIIEFKNLDELMDQTSRGLASNIARLLPVGNTLLHDISTQRNDIAWLVQDDNEWVESVTNTYKEWRQRVKSIFNEGKKALPNGLELQVAIEQSKILKRDSGAFLSKLKATVAAHEAIVEIAKPRIQEITSRKPCRGDCNRVAAWFDRVERELNKNKGTLLSVSKIHHEANDSVYILTSHSAWLPIRLCQWYFRFGQNWIRDPVAWFGRSIGCAWIGNALFWAVYAFKIALVAMPVLCGTFHVIKFVVICVLKIIKAWSPITASKDFESYYAILGIDISRRPISQEEVLHAYSKRMQELPQGSEALKIVEDAYDKLQDSTNRELYDATYGYNQKNASQFRKHHDYAQHYRVLGLEESASAEDIERAYQARRLLFIEEWSPWQYEVQQAYEILSDRNQRDGYGKLYGYGSTGFGRCTKVILNWVTNVWNTFIIVWRRLYATAWPEPAMEPAEEPYFVDNDNPERRRRFRTSLSHSQRSLRNIRLSTSLDSHDIIRPNSSPISLHYLDSNSETTSSQFRVASLAKEMKEGISTANDLPNQSSANTLHKRREHRRSKGLTDNSDPDTPQ